MAAESAADMVYLGMARASTTRAGSCPARRASRKVSRLYEEGGPPRRDWRKVRAGPRISDPLTSPSVVPLASEPWQFEHRVAAGERLSSLPANLAVNGTRPWKSNSPRAGGGCAATVRVVNANVKSTSFMADAAIYRPRLLNPEDRWFGQRPRHLTSQRTLAMNAPRVRPPSDQRR